MNPLAAVARRLGLTEGQAYTACTGFVVAASLLGLGLPALGDVATEAPDRSVAAGASQPVPPLPLPGGIAADAIAPPTEDVPPATLPAPTTDELATPSTPGGPVDLPPVERPAPRTSDRATGAPRPAPPAPPAPTTSTPTSTPPGGPAPSGLRIATGRYASASGPLVPAGAPGAFLPAGVRVGMADKRSYLRLSGTGSTLRLGLSTEPGHQLGDVSAVTACRIVTPGWAIEDGSALSAAPEVDPIACRLGRFEAGVWTFSLDGIDAANGVALVASGASTGSFQVTFKGTAL